MSKHASLAHKVAQQIIDQEDIRTYDVWTPTNSSCGADTGPLFELDLELQEKVEEKVATLKPRQLFDLIRTSPVQPFFGESLIRVINGDLNKGLRYIAREVIIEAMEDLIPMPLQDSVPGGR